MLNDRSHSHGVQAQAGMVMKKWLDQRAVTSPLLSELNRNAKEAGWQRPQVSALSPVAHESLQAIQSGRGAAVKGPLAQCWAVRWQA